jgi:hypothetical protein
MLHLLMLESSELSVHATKAAPSKGKKTSFATPQERVDALNKAQPGDPCCVLAQPTQDFPQGRP